MTDKIKDRIEKVQKSKAQFIANTHACDGAIIELTALLKEVEESELKEQESKATPENN